jgi:hypothetical protein
VSGNLLAIVQSLPPVSDGYCIKRRATVRNRLNIQDLHTDYERDSLRRWPVRGRVAIETPQRAGISGRRTPCRSPVSLFLAPLSTRRNVPFHSFKCLRLRCRFPLSSKCPGHWHFPRHSSCLQDLRLPQRHRTLFNSLSPPVQLTWKKIILQPTKVDTDTGLVRGAQFGYNQCNSTTEGPTSLCQTSFVNSIDGLYYFLVCSHHLYL